MTEEQENRVIFNGDSENFCKVAQPLWFRFKYLLFYLFFRGELNWKDSWFKKRRDGYKAVYDGVLLSKLMNYSFVKVDNSTKYNTKVNYIGELCLNTTLEKYSDLSNFCGKELVSKTSCILIKAPNKKEFLKYFYKDLWYIKHKKATLYFNIFNQLVKAENIESIKEDVWYRIMSQSYQTIKNEELKSQKI